MKAQDVLQRLLFHSPPPSNRRLRSVSPLSISDSCCCGFSTLVGSLSGSDRNLMKHLFTEVLRFRTCWVLTGEGWGVAAPHDIRTRTSGSVLTRFSGGPSSRTAADLLGFSLLGQVSDWSSQQNLRRSSRVNGVLHPLNLFTGPTLVFLYFEISGGIM